MNYCNKIIFLFLLTLSSSFAAEKSFMSFGNLDYETRESNWVFNIEVNQFSLPVTLPKFEGKYFEMDHKTKSNSTTGLGMYAGANVHLFYGLSSTLKVGGLYHQTLDNTLSKASKEVDLDFANKRKKNNAQALEMSLSLNYIFETSFINIQPFIEAAKGQGSASLEHQYNFVGENFDILSDDEIYDISINQNFKYQRNSLGINFINNLGMISYLKVSQYSLDISYRKIKGSIKNTSSKSQTINKKLPRVLEKDLILYSAGIGFLF